MPVDYVDPSGLANFWNPITWGVPDPLGTWGSFFNPLNSQYPSTLCGAAKGTAQGVANTANGVQDIAIGTANLPGAAINGIAWAEERVGILDPKDRLRVPYIPSPDWSRDLITHEGGSGWGDTHNWSKFSGGTGVTAGLSALRAARLARLAPRGVDNVVRSVGDDITNWLGKDVRVITNEAGDRIFLSNDGLRRIRFDFNRPHPHLNPHSHIEIKVGGKWIKSGPIYPKDVVPK